ncbi:MAG TPA: hypothetical protein VHP99_17970 [Pyrinomonadaceae bacterium]|jgi:hypothetical protein|nr:hypothetical protein [Pyrinomonadaceae bacterium]
MHLYRLMVLSVVILVTAAAAQAQRRWERLPAPRDPQFYVPRNKLEDFEGRVETLLIRGRHWVGTVRGQNGTARVEATEVRDSVTSDTASGAVITIKADGGPADEIRSLIDYDEIDALLRALDAAAKASESITRLSHFEVRYRTKGDFEIMVFKQLENNVVAAAIEGGFFERSRLYLSIDDLVKVRWMIAQAKERLDQK